MTIKTNGKAQPWQAQQRRRRARQWHRNEKLEDQQTTYTSLAKPSQR
ncbi:hypothetical protein GP5015_1276 [gamma proteobacterium HTCC5015]|nr:hypothetical protein GP5015_1276 [gamma proteobacterium HTCC5015]